MTTGCRRARTPPFDAIAATAALCPTSRRPPDGRRRRDGVRVKHHDAIAATACRYNATPSTRNEPRRRAGTWGAPFGYLALFWTLAAFSFFWRAAQSEAERPSGTYLGVFKYRARARVRGQLSGVARAPPRRTTLICSGSILCSCARRGRRPRATASHRCFFQLHSYPPRRAGPGGPAPRVGGGSRGEAAQNSVSDAARAPIHSHGRPGDAARREGRGAAGKGEDDRGLHTANLPPAILLSKSHDDMACGKKCTRPGA